MADLTRRELLSGMGGMALTAGLPPVAPGPRPEPPMGSPHRADFAIPPDITFINSAYTHPLPRKAVDAVKAHLARRSVPGVTMPDSGELSAAVKGHFAALINAKPNELSFIPNTSTGENLVVAGLGIPGSGGNVVTDGLHFDGAILHLQALQRQGLDLRIAMPKDGRIEMADLEKLVDRNTRLIEVSQVAMYNGFEHDLKAVSDLAHAHGAYVYADIIQGAGAVPLDVRATGVDFCACASFKWLMADFGLGFLYVREELLDRVMHRTTFGYGSAPDIVTHFLPYDPPATAPFSWDLGSSASSHFEVGSKALGPLAALGASLPYLRELGVANIQAWRQPLLARLHAEMPRLGLRPVTPAGTTSPLISFVFDENKQVAARLAAKKINARVGKNYLRLSPSVFNDMADIERVLAALS